MPLYSPPIHGKLMWPHALVASSGSHFTTNLKLRATAFLWLSEEKTLENPRKIHCQHWYRMNRWIWTTFRTPWRSEVRLALCAQWIFQSIPQKVLQQRREIFADLIERSGASRSENAQWIQALLTTRRTFSFLKTWKKSWPWITNPCRNWKHVHSVTRTESP
jgi:hypothetical protein